MNHSYMKHPVGIKITVCYNHSMYKSSQSQPTHILRKTFITRRLVSTLQSGHRQTIIQECEQIHQLKTLSLDISTLYIKYTLKYTKLYVKYTKGKSITKRLKDELKIKQLLFLIRLSPCPCVGYWYWYRLSAGSYWIKCRRWVTGTICLQVAIE